MRIFHTVAVLSGCGYKTSLNGVIRVTKNTSVLCHTDLMGQGINHYDDDHVQHKHAIHKYMYLPSMFSVPIVLVLRVLMGLYM